MTDPIPAASVAELRRDLSLEPVPFGRRLGLSGSEGEITEQVVGLERGHSQLSGRLADRFLDLMEASLVAKGSVSQGPVVQSPTARGPA